MRALHLVAGGLFVLTSALGAQGTDSGRRAIAPRGRAAIRVGRGMGGQAADRVLLEGRARQALGVAVRRQLKLDDQQMRQLQRTDQKFEPERRALTRDERQARQTLKAAMEDSTSAGQPRIDSAMQRMLQVQRRRVELLEAEQKELSGFLTPRQRAQYFAIRERVMRRMLEMQEGSGGGRRGVPPPP